MKIIVIHGDDFKKIYERLSKFTDVARERSWEVVYLDSDALSLSEQISSSSLFEKERFFVIRDISKLVKKEVDWINKRSQDFSGNLIIYHEGYIGKTLLNSLPKGIKVEEYRLPKLIYSFLENLYPGNSLGAIKMLHRVIEKEPPEYVFSLVAKHIRDIYWVKVDAKSMAYPSWRVNKLKVQSSEFKIEDLKDIINKLAEIDVDVKTGKADLVSSLDLLIIKNLQ